MKDLVVLVADIQQQATMQVLLSHRHSSLNIREPNFDIFRHMQKDPGIYHRGGKFLSVLRAQYRHALVIIDKEWEGGPNNPVTIAQKVQNDLDNNGWRNRSDVVVIDPELEIWVWADSPHVYDLLGMDLISIKSLGEEKAYWPPGQNKPARPKELLEEILRVTGKRRSASLFKKLAGRVGLARCRDQSFTQLKNTLLKWFQT